MVIFHSYVSLPEGNLKTAEYPFKQIDFQWERVLYP